MIKQLFNNKEIRFIEKDGEYWAVASDVAKILGFRDAFNATKYLPEHVKDTLKGSTLGGQQMLTVINEKGIYRLVMRSNKPEAEDFQDWICDVLVELRQATGLKGYEAFRMLDKQKQKEAMAIIQRAYKSDKPINYIKANTIANKAVSTAFGYEKMIGKEEMTPEMLEVRQVILDDVVKLTETKNQFNLDIKVSKSIYDKYGVG
ncbi:phage repressor protein [Staphylococcus chromogenes]|uniref:BRO-N domain-containing protein n=1 Tax=Staphylococcus chromogenes TaxID=46126 RepID=UPI000D1BD568|nr:BRO family protein [Staphylococcus chromogenes]PTG05971.1 phage repressor protein [Staphylococcus chromogenes]PTG12525.1 phage repressor protein [Staphylococcus chromogenes]TJY14568.1 phage repressor protein [Staphylococcus chromogenes]UXS76182.1 phage repressor protein [Staphylococcus chromogenes]